MVDLIPQIVKKVWGHWNIRGVILFSLSLQIFLIFFAPFRKRTQKIWLMSSIWSAYLLADYAANFCVGLISNSQLDSLKSSKSTKTIVNTNSDLLAFWAPFLLLHLGGPDTITAFALEDNELWLRHLLGFISQVITSAYVFMLSMPGNVLWLPTLLVFVAGVIKYSERTCSLYLGSIDNFRKSTRGKPNSGLDYPLLMNRYHSWQEAGIPTHFIDIPDRYEISIGHPTGDITNEQVHNNGLDDVEIVQQAFYFFNKFKGLIADMIFSFTDRNESRKYFHGLSADNALRVIEIELNFLYEAFYTKFFIVFGKLGFCLRLVATILLASALAIFHSIDKEKYGFDAFDVRITYALLCGAVALDVIAFFMFICSDHAALARPPFNRVAVNRVVKFFLRKKKPEWKKSNHKFYELSTRIFFRRWNGSMAGFNLIDYCIDQCPKEGNSFWGRCFSFVKGQYLQFHGLPGKPVLKEVWEFIFKELRRKSEWATDVQTTRRICDARGDLVIEQRELGESLLNFVDVNEVAFDESIILWHIATHLCITSEEEENPHTSEAEENPYWAEKKNPHHLISRIISDYMLYLLIFQSKMISVVAGIGIKRFEDTCEETTKFFQKMEGGLPNDSGKYVREMLKVRTDVKAIDIKGDESKSMLFDACRLAKQLMKLKEVKWEIISQVWVEMLSFAATNCRPTAHVQQLSKGGELISLVWLLMFRLGLGKQFQIKEAKYKLMSGNIG